MRRGIIGCLIGSLTMSAAAQGAADMKLLSAIAELYHCSTQYGKRFAATPALAQDVGDAAVYECQPQLIVASKLSATDGTAQWIAWTRSAAIHALLDARYPESPHKP